MAGLSNKLNPNSMVLTDRGYVSAAEAEYQHSLGNLNIVGRDGTVINSQDLDINKVYLAPSPSSDTFNFVDDFVNTDESGRDFDARVFTRGDADVFQSNQAEGRYFGDTSAPRSAQEMFNQTYAEAMANESLANDLEMQGVPDNISREDYFAKMNDTLLSLGIDPAQYTKLDSGLETGLENDLLNNGVDMLDPDVTGIGGDESIVTDDPEAEWDKVDKTKDLASIFQDALDIFGAYDRNSIRKVVDVVNERGVSAQDVATMTGNTVESINQAAAESDTAITNQGTAGDTGAADTSDVFNEATDTLNTGEVLTPSAPEDQGIIDPAVVTGGDEVIPALETPVTTNDTPVIPVLDTPVIAEDPAVIVDDTPILPTIMQPTPKQTTNISLFQSIQDTPITDSLFFEPKFTELDNIPVGMFERFLQATGGR